MSHPPQDPWAQWLFHRRDGDAAGKRLAALKTLHRIRDRVLHYAQIAEGETLLDVGTGEGLLAFSALPYVGAGKGDFERYFAGSARVLPLPGTPATRS